jgi:Protein of unknown function (DUF3810)
MVSRRLVWTAIIVAAIGAALLPIPQILVERVYSSGVYPHWQRVMTTASNLVPFAAFDLLCLAAVVVVALHFIRGMALRGWRKGALRTIAAVLRWAALTYLIFLATWGLNYRRVGLVQKVAFDAARVNSRAAGDLGDRAASGLNALYAAAHSTPVSIDELSRAFHDAQSALGARLPIVPGQPKTTLLGGYFHQAAIAGMTDPFFLETLLAPDLLEVERPFVTAHEWAHLAGYADEAEANYLAWLTCMRSSPTAHYSAWLAIIGYVQPASRPLKEALAIGPRIDLFALRYRYTHTSAMVRFAARESYDKYLKANRVQAGVESYDLMLQLILGTPTDARGNPILR